VVVDWLIRVEDLMVNLLVIDLTVKDIQAVAQMTIL